MAKLAVGVLKERGADERRVALVPTDIGRLLAAGMTLLVEAGAGADAWYGDETYADVGAEVVTRADLCARSDVLACVGPPEYDVVNQLRAGHVVVGLLGLRSAPDRVLALADRGVTALSFDGVPRRASRAQTMDALTSQANVAGYKAVLVAANAFGGLLPMQMTAAGTSRPARVLVLGAGVAGLQAISTARRLGAVVSAYDVRPAARQEIASVGATFVELPNSFGGADAGGYARPLGADEQRALPDALAPHVARADIVITTAQVPGRTPPLLVTDGAVKAMRPGSVIVDLAASPLGGNVEHSRPGQTVVVDNTVTVIGAHDLSAAMPVAASEALSRNVSAVLRYLIHDGLVRIDTSDEVQAGMLAIHEGRITDPRWSGAEWTGTQQ
jgi:NAD(P) transhydrogenase subunit alpha